MQFSDAFINIRQHRKVARSSWEPNTFVAMLSYGVQEPNINGGGRGLFLIDNGMLTPWLPSHSDLFAWDWQVVE